ncbi:MAG TPA: hypothetical protein PK896_02510 [bacterium]|nr:hypothetical protein [bacterium]
MCKNWTQEKRNHHFPELNRRKRISGFFLTLFNWRLASITLVAITLAVGFWYLVQTNIAATRGYKIKELNQRISELTEENKKLNLKYIEAKSMANMVEQVKGLDLVVTAEVDTVYAVGSAVALR